MALKRAGNRKRLRNKGKEALQVIFSVILIVFPEAFVVVAYGPRESHKDKTRQFYYIFTQNTVITDLAPLVVKANRGGPGETKIYEIW